MTLHIYGARNSQNGMIFGPGNGQKMKVSGPRKHHYVTGFFSGPKNRQNGTISGPKNCQYDQENLYADFYAAILPVY